MLDIKYIRENIDETKKNALNRNMHVDVDKLIIIDKQRRDLQFKMDELKSQQKKCKNHDEARSYKEKIQKIEEDYNKILLDFNDLLEQIPNITHPDAPIGKSDKDNKEREKIGELPKFNFEPKDHLALANALDIIDFEKGANVTGQKFYYLKGAGALLELALINFAISILLKKGYVPIITPDLAKASIIKGSGFNPRDDSDQIYNIKNTDLSLIATAEITVGGYHQNEVLSENTLPLKYVGLSHCFRKEAGSYGQESKGFYRVHQFTKVEMYIICTPEFSEELHQELLGIEKEIFSSLELPYRVVDICTGDLGGAAYKKYDIEAWMPMKNDYGEVTSTSNCTDYQARRLNIKYQDKSGKKNYVHTLNGTAIAVSRAFIAILENYQQRDGSIIIPKVLQPFMFGIKSISLNK